MARDAVLEPAANITENAAIRSEVATMNGLIKFPTTTKPIKATD
jgi:hypothetical protein